MREDELREKLFLQTLWQNRLFNHKKTNLADGTAFEITNPGLRNDESRNLPDFSFASIKLPVAGITLYGSIKIDSRSSSWREQGTVNAPEFSSVILHVVLEQDVVIYQGGRQMPTFVLTPEDRVVECFRQLQHRQDCPTYIAAIDPVQSHHILTRVMSDRLARKSGEVLDIFESTGRNWHETAYICFVRAFGYGQQKKSAFETLARTLPLRYLRLHSDSALRMEALLLGQSGYLSDIDHPDPYTRQLQEEYAELRYRHNINPRHISWNGLPVRPVSLPVLSLVRIAAILRAEESFLNRVLAARNYPDLVTIFDILIPEYWHNHIAPSKRSSMNVYGMSREKSELLIINFVIPFIEAYGTHTSNEELRERAMDLYEELPAEGNRYINWWSSGGLKPLNSFFSQAFIQLSTEFCQKNYCGSCPVGTRRLAEAFHSGKIAENKTSIPNDDIK